MGSHSHVSHKTAQSNSSSGCVCMCRLLTDNRPRRSNAMKAFDLEGMGCSHACMGGSSGAITVRDFVLSSVMAQYNSLRPRSLRLLVAKASRISCRSGMPLLCQNVLAMKKQTSQLQGCLGRLQLLRSFSIATIPGTERMNSETSETVVASARSHLRLLQGFQHKLSCCAACTPM